VQNRIEIDNSSKFSKLISKPQNVADPKTAAYALLDDKKSANLF